MAFERGALGESGGRSPLEALNVLLTHLRDEDVDVSSGEVKEGEGWASSTVRISRPAEPVLEQYVQVSVGGEILDIFLEEARAALGEDATRGKDLMLTTLLSGMTDHVFNDRLMAYALTEWRGIPWGEASGFRS
ncbi:hypothetical protein ACLB9X_34280 [Streptomyces sp. 5K101]|uniref:hypothetical protein n=1 Tax=Streptomyces sp. 5K101 TaxID=3390037 RepID=UPI003976BEB5